MHPEDDRTSERVMVFLTTPHNLYRHFRTKIDRLILQLWPVFLFGSAMLSREASGADGTAAGEL